MMPSKSSDAARLRRYVAALILVSTLSGALLTIPRAAVGEPGVDYILIRDETGGGGSVVGDRMYHYGENDTYYAAGYNITSGYVKDVEAYWQSNDSYVIWIDNKSALSAIIYPQESGVAQVTAYLMANWSMVGTTGNLTVISDVDYVILRDQPNGGGNWFGDTIVQTETWFSVYAAGYNNTSGYRRDVPVYWSSTNQTICEVYAGRYISISVGTYGEGLCRIKGTYAPGISNDTGTITVRSDVDYVMIRDASGGMGVVVGDVAYVIDMQDAFYAAGYNYTSGYLRDVQVYWSTTNSTVCPVPSSRSPSAWFIFDHEGTCTVSINYAWKAWNSTGTVTVIMDIDYVVVRDGAGGTGQALGNKTLYVATLYDFYAAGYNRTDGFKRDLQVLWWTSDEKVCKPVFGNLTLRKMFEVDGGRPGVCTLSVSYKSKATNTTGDLTVVLNIDYITIRDAPNGMGNELGSKALYTYVLVYLYAAGYNDSTGYLRDLSVTWTSSNTSVCPFWSWSGNGIKVEPRLPGTCVFTVDFRGLLSNSTGTLPVYLDIDYIIVRDGASGTGSPVDDRSYFTGVESRYFAAGYNSTLGYRRDLQASWSSNDTTVCKIDPFGYVGFWAEGSCRITANFYGLVQNSTGTLSVVWDVDYLTIMDASGGTGAPVGSRIYTLGSSVSFFAAGFNYSLGYRRDLKSDWQSSATWICTITTAQRQAYARVYFAQPGLCTINATYLTRVSNSTGILTVVSEIDYVTIRDAPNGGGNWVGDGDYIVTTEHILYAAGYNTSSGFVRDEKVTWTTNNTASCGLTLPPSQAYVTFKAVRLGFCRVKADYFGLHANYTGTLHVVPKPVIVVDDSGTGDYLTIHEAVENATDGTIIRVMDGTYHEHVVVDKSVIIEGLNKATTWVNGSADGAVFTVTAKDVRISGLTIENAEYGVLIERALNTYVDHNTIRWYEYGVYSNRAKGSHIEKNLITRGANGVVTYQSENDAVWNNEISYNTVYGAKDYDSSLAKCFNWNLFHHNNIAYYYDPTGDLAPLVLDTNRFEDNGIAILVENSSSISITNNTVVRSEKAVVVLNGSPFIGYNEITDAAVGIELVNSSSRVLDNAITDSENGITATGGSPTIEENSLRNIAFYSIRLEGVSDASLVLNDFDSGRAVVSNSSLSRLWVGNGSYEAVNTSVGDVNVGTLGVVEMRLWASFEVLHEDGTPVANAHVRVLNSQGEVIVDQETDSTGRTMMTSVTRLRITSGGTLDLNPYLIEVTAEGETQKFEVTVDSSKMFTLVFRVTVPGQPLPWPLLVVSSLALISLAVALDIERTRYSLLSLFVILYVKVKKADVLEQFTRGRIYGYIEANQGEHFGALRKALSLSSGNAVYHLQVLEKQGFIVSRNDRTYKRFYPKGARLPPENHSPLSEIQSRVLSCITSAPGISQQEVAGVLGVHQSTLEYQLIRLEKLGQVRKERAGRKVRLYPAQPKQK